MVQKRGYVYFIHAPEAHRIKIGYSAQHPDTRLNGLRSASPVPLVRLGFMWGTPDLERELHERFRGLRTHREWFRDDAELMDFVVRETERWRMLAPTSWEDRPEAWVETNARIILIFEWMKRRLCAKGEIAIRHGDFVEMHLPTVLGVISENPYWHADRSDKCLYLPENVVIP